MNWVNERPLYFTPGDLGQLSMPLTATKATIGVLLRQGTNLEFSENPPFKKSEFKSGTFQGKVQVK